MKYILAVLIVFLVCYLSFWFVTLEFNPVKWNLEKRALYVVIYFFSSAVSLGVMKDIEQGNK
jgi:hypothetical protein